MTFPSVTALAKSIQTLADKLTNQGYQCDVTTVKTGRGGDYSTSYVELEVNDENGDLIGWYKFLANGYASNSKKEYGGNSIKEMKELFLIDFNKDTKV